MSVVSIKRDATEYADDCVDLVWRVTGIFQSCPASLQKNPLLRVHYFSFFGVYAKKRRIETVGFLQHSAGRHIAPARPQSLRVKSRSTQFIVGENGDRFTAINQIFPELFDTIGAGKSARHANYRYTFVL